MTRLTEKILAYTAGLPEGAPVSAKSLLHLGNRAAVDQALSRLKCWISALIVRRFGDLLLDGAVMPSSQGGFPSVQERQVNSGRTAQGTGIIPFQVLTVALYHSLPSDRPLQ